MTAFMIKPYSDRVEILTDGATYTPEGVLLSTSYKVHRYEYLPFAIVGSGSVAGIEAVASAIFQVIDVTCSVDDCLEIVTGSLRKIAQTATGDSVVRIGIAAISEASGPVCSYFNSFDEGEVKAFSLVPMPRGMAQGMEPSHDEMMANIANLKGVRETIKHDGPWLFEQMRKKKTVWPAFPEKPSFYSIGGHLDFTVMTKDGYTVERLLTWPDVVGELIDPFAADQASAA